MKHGEESIACRLAVDVFNEFVAPHYSQEGVSEFLRYIDPDLMAKRVKFNHFVLMAEMDDMLVGIIEVRDFNHISLLFVPREVQRKGIAKRLLNEALQICSQNNPNLSRVSVHSSSNSIEAYEHLGFRSEGSEKLERGIRYVPMILQVNKNNGG
jgi:predicted GNAT family N-acyltransferase